MIIIVCFMWTVCVVSECVCLWIWFWIPFCIYIIFRLNAFAHSNSVILEQMKWTSVVCTQSEKVWPRRCCAQVYVCYTWIRSIVLWFFCVYPSPFLHLSFSLYLSVYVRLRKFIHFLRPVVCKNQIKKLKTKQKHEIAEKNCIECGFCFDLFEGDRTVQPRHTQIIHRSV